MLPLRQGQDEDGSFLSFLYAYSIVSTRAFVIDAYHIIGIIPFCDLFNHSSVNAHTSLLSDAFVCRLCGSILHCQHDTDPPTRIANECEGRQEWLNNLSDEYRRRLEQEGDMLDMRAEKDIRYDEEIFSCYEQGVGDGKLLVEWGFIERSGSGKGLTWNARDVIEEGHVRMFVEILSRGFVYERFSEDDEIGWTEDDDQSGGIDRGLNDHPTSLSNNADRIQCRLIGPADTSQFGLLNLWPNGNMSINLIIAMYLRSIPPDNVSDIDPYEIGIMRVLSEITRHVPDGEPDGEQSSLLSVAAKTVIEAVIDLLDTRHQGYSPNLTAETLERIHTVSLVFGVREKVRVLIVVCFVVRFDLGFCALDSRNGGIS